MAGKEKSAKSWHTNLIPIPQLLRNQQKNPNFFSFTHLFLPSPIEFCQQKLAHFSTSFCWHWYWQQLNWATITNLSQQTQLLLFSWLKNFDVEGRKAKVFKSFGVFGRFGRTIMLVYFDFRVGIVVVSSWCFVRLFDALSPSKKVWPTTHHVNFWDFGLSWTSFLTFESQFKKESKQRFYAAEEARGC